MLEFTLALEFTFSSQQLEITTIKMIKENSCFVQFL